MSSNQSIPTSVRWIFRLGCELRISCNAVNTPKTPEITTHAGRNDRAWRASTNQRGVGCAKSLGWGWVEVELGFWQCEKYYHVYNIDKSSTNMQQQTFMSQKFITNFIHKTHKYWILQSSFYISIPNKLFRLLKMKIRFPVKNDLFASLSTSPKNKIGEYIPILPPNW